MINFTSQRWYNPVLRFQFLTVFSILTILTIFRENHDSGLLKRRLQLHATTSTEPLRYLALGTSHTWGATLPNRHNAYPYLLSPTATNLAIRASGPTYPGVCAESLIGDEIYDVILLEYFQLASDGLVSLAQRLRKRFPEAIIVFLAVWDPTMIHYNNEADNRMGHEWKNLKWDWAIPTGNAIKSPESLSNFASTTYNWEFSDFYMSYLAEQVEEARKLVNGYTLQWEWKGDAKQLLLQRELFFAEDWHHLSERGHALIAKGIQGILKTRAKPKRSDVVGSWGDGDYCRSWYETGDCTLEYSDNIVLNKFYKVEVADKHALDIPPEGGTITIDNPFDGERKLLFTYMATGPSKSIYPKVEVFLDTSPSKKKIIDPLVKGSPYPVHITQIAEVGTVSPGKNILHIQPVEMSSEAPFRIVATSVLGLNAVVHSDS